MPSLLMETNLYLVNLDYLQCTNKRSKYINTAYYDDDDEDDNDDVMTKTMTIMILIMYCTRVQNLEIYYISEFRVDMSAEILILLADFDLTVFDLFSTFV